MLTIVIVILVILFATGGGFYGRRASWGPRGFLGLLLLALIVIVAVWALNELLLPPLPMIDAPAPINKP